jgi:hypothetical protein
VSTATIQLGRLECGLDLGAATRITLRGRLDDTAPLAALVANIPTAGEVAIDTDGITFVNSIGMREWMRLVRAIAGRGQRLTLERVSDVLFTQMNMIPEFRRAAHVASFHAQYVCGACGDETAPLLEVAEHLDALRASSFPKLTCAVCGGVTELADFPERYVSIFAL